MNPDDRLTDALDDIAGAAGRSTSHLTDDELVAGVRRRATVLRRRRAAGRATTAAAAVVAVAVGGVVAAQQLGGTRATPAPAGPLACGASAARLVPDADPALPRLRLTVPTTVSPALGDTAHAFVEHDPGRLVLPTHATAYVLDGERVVGLVDDASTVDDRSGTGTDVWGSITLPAVGCADGATLEGPLTLLVVADVTDLASSSSEVLRLVSERRPVTLEPEPAWEVPDDVAPTMAYGCGGPTVDDTAWLDRSKDVLAQSSTPLRIAGTTARTTSARGTTLDLGTTLTVDGDVLADGVQAFLLQDGHVVARAHTPTPDGTWTTFPAGPGDGGIDAWPAADVPRLDGPLDVDVPGRSCETGTLLPAGDYQLVVGLYGSVGFQVEVTVVESLGTVTITD
ncbi:hypothetical protein [Sanguibacter massiliensis]|uniref:hypothetical protein n=1 Tax=Sanguibacter massiliensis TaxID=1973217 RepID=UPI000C854D2F|nr:hypothetical protein [Sanguibacter massiliensis]